MKRIVVPVVTLLIAMILVSCSQKQDYSAKKEESFATKGSCVIEVTINGRTIECDYSQESANNDKQAERLKAMLDGKLNEYSETNGHWIRLCDSHGTYIRDVRIGRDPFNFFPELPVMFFDNFGNLISLTSFDIHEGYLVYSFCYDEQNRVVCSQERLFMIPYADGPIGSPYEVDLLWEYADDGSYVERMGSCVWRTDRIEYREDRISCYDAEGNLTQDLCLVSDNSEYIDGDEAFCPGISQTDNGTH